MAAKSNLIILLENLFGLFNCLLWLGSILCIVVSFLEPEEDRSRGNNVGVAINCLTALLSPKLIR